MGLFREREEDENDGIPVDLKQKVCPTCRRKLQPWEATCPEDGATPVEGVEMGSVEDQILGRLNPDLLDGPAPEEPSAEAADPDVTEPGGPDVDEPGDDPNVVTVRADPPVPDLPEPPGGRDLPKWAG